MDSRNARAGAGILHPAVNSSVAGNLNSSCSMTPPPSYAMLVRLSGDARWIAIRPVGRAALWKLVKAPRTPRSVILSIFSSSLNPREGVADNQHWPPLGWRARVGQDDRLEASATVIGLRGQFSIAGWGVGPREGAPGADPWDPSGDGGVGDRTLSSIRPCRTIRGLLFTTRSRHRPTISLSSQRTSR